MVAAERALARNTATNAADPSHAGEAVPAARAERVWGLSTASAAFGALVGTAVLVAWALGLEAPTGLGGQTTMKANTGLGFLAIALSLGALRRRGTGRVRLAVRATALVVAGLALSTLAQDLLAWDLGIDRAIFTDPEPTPGSPHPRRMHRRLLRAPRRRDPGTGCPGSRVPLGGDRARNRHDSDRLSGIAR